MESHISVGNSSHLPTLSLEVLRHREPAGVAIPLDFRTSGRDCFVTETPRNDGEYVRKSELLLG